MMIEALATLASGGETTATATVAGFAAVQQLFSDMHEYRVRRMLQVGLQRDVAERISHLHTPNFM
jgi:hypothetical protein